MTKPSDLDNDAQRTVRINQHRYAGHWSLRFDKPCDDIWLNTTKLLNDWELTDVSKVTCTLEYVDPAHESNVTHWDNAILLQTIRNDKVKGIEIEKYMH